MNAAEKIVKLDNMDLYDEIMSFFLEFDNQVVNDPRYQNMDGTVKKSATRIRYEGSIREFTETYLNKSLEHLKIDDLLKLKKRDIIEYRTKLLEKGNGNKTVNLKLTSIKSMFKFLSSEYPELKDKIFNLKRLKENSDSYGSLSQTEAERFAQAAFDTERQKPYLKKYMIMFAIRSSFRLDEILNIRWKDFEPMPEKGICKVTCIGKGSKQNTNAISMNLYNDILKLKEINKESKWDKDEQIVFQISKDSVTDMMARLRKLLNAEDRNIVFHSFRGVAVDFALENGSIKDAAQQANHSNIATTYKHYVDKSRDYTQSAGVRMEEDIDLSFLEDLTVDQFKEFIKQSGYKIQLEIRNYFDNKR